MPNPASYAWLPDDASELTRGMYRRKLTRVVDGENFFFGVEHEGRLGIPRNLPGLPDVLRPEIRPEGWTANFPPCQFTLREDQLPASEFLQSTTDGILQLATGRGKTVIALHAAAAVGRRTLVVTHSSVLLEQWVARASQVFDAPVGRIQGPVETWRVGDCVTVAMLQTLATHLRDAPPWLAESFGTVIYDEVQHLQGPWFASGIFFSPHRRWGLSATPFNGGPLDDPIRWNFGTSVYQDGDLAIRPWLRARWIPLPSGVSSDLDYDGPLKWTLLEQPERVQIAAKTTLRLKERGYSVLTMCPEVRVLEHIRDQLLHLGLDPASIGVLTGRVPRWKREEQIGKPVLLATQHNAISTEGLDRPETSAVVVVGDCSGSRPFWQIIGRAARVYPGKEEATVVFLIDDHPRTVASMTRRLQEAEERGMEVDWNSQIDSERS